MPPRARTKKRPSLPTRYQTGARREGFDSCDREQMVDLSPGCLSRLSANSQQAAVASCDVDEVCVGCKAEERLPWTGAVGVLLGRGGLCREALHAEGGDIWRSAAASSQTIFWSSRGSFGKQVRLEEMVEAISLH